MKYERLDVAGEMMSANERYAGGRCRGFGKSEADKQRPDQPRSLSDRHRADI